MNPDEQGTPTPPDTPLYRQFLATQQAKQPSGPDTDLYRQFRAQQGPQIRHDPALRARQAARGKISDQEEADAAPGYGERLATHILNYASGVPGVEAVEAGAGALGSRIPASVPFIGSAHPMDHQEALSTLRENTQQIPTALRVGEQMAGGASLIPFLPRSAVKAGALIGGASGALDADQSRQGLERAGRTAAGAVGGAVLGKGLEVLSTGAPALFTPLAEDNIAAQQIAREKSGEALYGKALAEGQGRTNTPAINRVLQEPDNAAISEAQGDLRQHAGSQPTDPERLDALYKAHSDRAKALKRGLESAIPNRPNTGTSSLIDTKLAQQDLVDAMSGGKSMPGPMPSYRAAVQDQAERFGNIDATRSGQDYLKASLRQTITPGRSLEQTTPRALSTEAEGASPTNRSFLSKGILGAAKEDIKHHPVKNLLGGRAMWQAPDLLRRAGSPGQQIIDLLNQSALFGTNASIK